MTTLAIVAGLIFVALGGYAWGSSRLLPLLARDLFKSLILDGVVDLVHSHPSYRWGRFGRITTWLFFGVPVIALIFALAILLVVPVTCLLMISMLRARRQQRTPQPDPDGPVTPGALMRLLQRFRSKKSNEALPDNVRRMRKRAMMHA